MELGKEYSRLDELSSNHCEVHFAQALLRYTYRMRCDVSKPEEHTAALVPAWLWRTTVGALTLIAAAGVATAVWLGTRPVVTGTPITTRGLTWAFSPGASGDQTDKTLILRTDAEQAGGVAYATGSLSLGDSVVQVRATRLSGPDDAGYGMIVRYRAPDEYVALLIGGDGYIAVGQMSGGTWRWRVPWQQWPHIRRGSAENLLRAECRADRCRFFVNGEFAFEVDGLPAEGRIGPAVWQPTNTGDVSAGFQDWRLWNQ
jgi:hypothetical protein